jgi:DNA-binding NtrC family response regulator
MAMGRLLVIDADTAGRGIVRSRLVDAGHQVQVAESAALGIEEGLSGGHDAVLVAAILDGSSRGTDICRTLHSRRGLQDTALVVYALTGSEQGLLERAHEAGAHGVVLPEQASQLERVVDAALVAKGRVAALRERQRLLSLEQRHLAEELRRSLQGLPANADDADSARAFSTGRPDAVLLVDAGGTVRWSDRGVWSMFGTHAVGASLGELTPGSGLDDLVRGCRLSVRQAFRFDLPARGDRPGRPLLASVYPLDDELRAVLLTDACRRHVAAAGAGEPGIPRQQVAALVEAAARAHGLDRIPGDGPTAAELRRRISTRAADREPVLLVGETGTGRTFLGRVLHYLAPNPGPLLQLKCAGLSRESLALALFGSTVDGEDGVDRPGALKLARGGTVLLQDIDAMPMELQETLLGCLRNHTVQRAGAKLPETIDVRLVATTSRELGSEAVLGTFTPRLAELLQAFRLDLPPLRARGPELQSLVRRRLDVLGAVGIEDDAMHLLRQHAWPRNLTELEDTLDRAVCSAGQSPIRVEDLPRALTELAQELPDYSLLPEQRPASSPTVSLGSPWMISPEDPITFDFYEKQAIVRALHACRGDRMAAAHMLQVGKSTLYRKIRRFGIE